MYLIGHAPVPVPQIDLKSDSLHIRNLSADVEGTSIESKHSSLINIYNAVILNQEDTVKVNAYFKFGDINFARFTPFLSSGKKNKEQRTSKDAEPKHYQFQAKGKIKARSFAYNKAVFENISTLYNVSDSLPPRPIKTRCL